jgi:hypothetical protein
MLINRNTLAPWLPVMASVIAVAALAACSGNMTGATPPVTQGAPGTTTGTVPQSVSSGGHPLSTDVPATPTPGPVRSAQVQLSISPTPIPLPTVAGYGGTVLVAPATPVPTATPLLDLVLQPMPNKAPLRDTSVKASATHPLLMLQLSPEGGDAKFVGGLSAVSFLLPLEITKVAKHYALGLYEMNLPPGPHTMFHKHSKGSSSNALLAMDDKTTLSKAGHTLSSGAVPFTLTENHHYSLVLYADQLMATPTPAPTGSGSPAASATPSASSASATPFVTTAPTVVGTPGANATATSTTNPMASTTP